MGGSDNECVSRLLGVTYNKLVTFPRQSSIHPSGSCYFVSLNVITSLVPRPPCLFCSLACVQYDTRKRKSAKNGEGLGTPIT